jgi:2-polyprenyl-3-methyl-5-hydroxy-6-metoxy-1,4-benzoquinol methylase
MHPTNAAAGSSIDFLRQLMSRYTTAQLRGVGPEEFRRHVEGFRQIRDHAMEGYTDPQRQRDLSIRFHWGHNHDFGSFVMSGRMENRHLWILSTFMDVFRALPRQLQGMRVLDIGCWTGGTSLLLAAMGAEVVAIDEVRKYVDALNYLRDSFGIPNLQARCMSLYQCGLEEFQNAFDYVLFAGVLYHVSDPVLACRLTFNCLRDGGTLLLETDAMVGVPPELALLKYWGPTVCADHGSQDELNRSGWNWFVPSPAALKQMILDVGYTDVRLGDAKENRLFAVACRKQHVDMLRAGLSVPGVR